MESANGSVWFAILISRSYTATYLQGTSCIDGGRAVWVRAGNDDVFVGVLRAGGGNIW